MSITIETKYEDRIEKALKPLKDCKDMKLLYFDLRIELEKQFDELIDDCARIIENWGNTPPNPFGRRAQVAKEIRQLKN